MSWWIATRRSRAASSTPRCCSSWRLTWERTERGWLLTDIKATKLPGIELENLIGNAWKFTARRDDATIESILREQHRFDETLSGLGFARDEWSKPPTARASRS